MWARLPEAADGDGRGENDDEGTKMSAVMMCYTCTSLGAVTSRPTPTNSTISVHTARSLSVTSPPRPQTTWHLVRSSSETPLELCTVCLRTYKWRRLNLVNVFPNALLFLPSRVVLS